VLDGGTARRVGDILTQSDSSLGAAGLIVLVGVAASIVPAMRVLAVDPTIALRSE